MRKQTKTKQQSKKQTQPKNVGRLYLSGLATYLYHRLWETGQFLVQLLLWPGRMAFQQVSRAWLNLRLFWQFGLVPWLKRHRQRLIWTAIALLLLGLIGGVAVFYLWPERATGLTTLYSRIVAGLKTVVPGRKMAEPIVVVATAPAEEVPVEPVLDGRP